MIGRFTFFKFSCKTEGEDHHFPSFVGCDMCCKMFRFSTIFFFLLWAWSSESAPIRRIPNACAGAVNRAQCEKRDACLWDTKRSPLCVEKPKPIERSPSSQPQAPPIIMYNCPPPEKLQDNAVEGSISGVVGAVLGWIFHALQPLMKKGLHALQRKCQDWWLKKMLVQDWGLD